MLNHQKNALTEPICAPVHDPLRLQLFLVATLKQGLRPVKVKDQSERRCALSRTEQPLSRTSTTGRRERLQSTMKENRHAPGAIVGNHKTGLLEILRRHAKHR